MLRNVLFLILNLLCGPNGKDTSQGEKKDAENAFLQDISQELKKK